MFHGGLPGVLLKHTEGFIMTEFYIMYVNVYTGETDQVQVSAPDADTAEKEFEATHDGCATIIVSEIK
jgi:hypothetical protein